MQEKLLKTATQDFRQHWIEFIYDLQNRICSVLEKTDGKAKFHQDEWRRRPGGGGRTRVIAEGDVLEKGGVNTSVVFGKVTPKMRKSLHLDGDKWFAGGISLVLHPQNPFVPTIHANYRYFELYEKGGAISSRWFGGGTDLTPYYLFEEDARHFHQAYKQVCDQFDERFYPLFKKNCDDYFVNTHRNNERRGIGGIFFDRRTPDDQHPIDFWFDFCKACGNAFEDAYLPIVQRRRNTLFDQDNRHWQEIRRGRYVEFNLIHDKGTLFGLKTNGRTESILMSLPPRVRFEYGYHPATGSQEDKLLQVCLQPADWA